VIWALLTVALVAIAGFGVALTARSKRDFDEQNEVVPGVRSPAPASWAGAHSREAKLHRRLGATVRSARANPRFIELGLAEQTASIEAEALAIDDRLVAAAALSEPHKSEALDVLEATVAELDQTVAELVTSVTVEDSKELLQHSVSVADERLRALAEARAEVERVDREASGTSAPPPPRVVEPEQPDEESGTATG